MNALLQHWSLDPTIAFLNHGSFGACPRGVLEVQSELRDAMERQPVEFLVRRLPDLLDAARDRLAAFLGADPDGLVAVTNSTGGVNAVLRSFDCEAGGELLVTDHEYNACRNALDYVAERRRLSVVVAPIPFPIASSDVAVDAILSRVTERTRLVLFDHVTSPTGLVLPVESIVAELRDRGVPCLIDGAHAPGMLSLELDALGADFYVGNCHKWLCAPKGAAFLWVRADRRNAVRPLVISHGANTPRAGRSRLHDEFDWTGTRDPTPFLCVPAAIEQMGALVQGGWPSIRRRNRELALTARRSLARALRTELPCPDSMIGSLAALSLPDAPADASPSALYSDRLQDRLYRKHRIEVPVVAWPTPKSRLVRISAQLYNDLEQYGRLSDALREELGPF